LQVLAPGQEKEWAPALVRALATVSAMGLVPERATVPAPA
jgi:hypothetical protein